jgi:hypothetical protein
MLPFVLPAGVRHASIAAKFAAQWRDSDLQKPEPMRVAGSSVMSPERL